jgi:7-cyano-7-deazaguanine synthase
MLNKEQLNKRTGKKVLLFSSGMDSFIINELEKPDVLLFIDNKSNYSELEKSYLKKTGHPNLVIVEDFINHSSIELDNMIIPARNLYFATIAANYGEEIILGATAGDRSTDKDHVFAELTSALLSHIYSLSHWSEKGDVRVNLKYKSWTKNDLIQAYVNKNMKDGIMVHASVNRLLTESFSCYHPTEEGGQCNKCKPDLRKYLAIYGATGIDTDYFYPIGSKPSEFFTKEVIQQWIKDLSKDTSRGRESLETIAVLKILNNKL